MDHKGAADYIIDQTSNQTQINFYLKKTLQFLVPISIISFLVSYFSVFHLIIFHPLQFYSSIFPYFTQLDRNCMFLICNGILAFLAKNLKLNNSSSPSTKSFDDDEDGALVFRGNAASLEYVYHTQEEERIRVQQQEQEDSVSQNAAEERESEMVIRLESEEWGEEDEDDEEIEESADVENSASLMMEEVRVSTEDLNKKFDEFIRKMKEELRIEARKQYLILV